MKLSKENKFLTVIALLTIFLATLFITHQLERVNLDGYDLFIITSIIGLLLIPFAEKIKIGNILELERVKESIEKVEIRQFLGEVVYNKFNDQFYFDQDGLHEIPDKQTIDFLQSRKGQLYVPYDIFLQMKKSYKMESVETCEILHLEPHYFLKLNEKKYYVEASQLAQLGIPDYVESRIEPKSREDLNRIESGR